MVPDEESKPEVSEAEAPGAKASPRRDRRSGRGRRGRGRGGRSRQHSVPREPEELSPQTEPEAIFELAEDPARSAEPALSVTESPEPISDVAAIPETPAPSTPASQASIEKAIEEVNAVIDTLRTALDDMEEVLEMLEVFERQKNVDEREIESLRRALRQGHRPRDAGHHHHR